ncbi:hypothetical protein A8990_106118 [Paenibacillus taihuensis]|uniref:Uncharacterized protein n=1 Tax=Paenibacillus taihuensis TaxID=1156355 RepID=A0A3D9SJY2_9BACL|nr:hypothetical protein [Paenibacillus taihuensis]REE90613.1 hypothetical protein A8990_106118 [Paenibacillus taihuensis]
MEPSKHGELDFFSIFDEAFDNERLFRVNEHMEVKLIYGKFDQLDKQIVYTLLNESSKRIEGNGLTCRIESNLLMKRVGMHEAELYRRIRKLLSFGLNVYTKIADAEYNFCVIKTLSENGKRVAYEVTFDHLDVIRKVFDDDFSNMLTRGVDEMPAGVHKLIVEGSELFFLSYMEAFNYGENKLKPQRTDYQIYHVQSNELVYAAEYINCSTKEMEKMDIQKPEVNKLNFMDIFNSEFEKDSISIGVSSDVIITIECPELTLLDKVVFTAIWSSGEKIVVDNRIFSTVSEEILHAGISMTEADLEESLKRLSHVAIEFTYWIHGERRKGRYNIFDVAGSIDGDGELQVVTMGVNSLINLKWLFSEESLKIIND